MNNLLLIFIGGGLGSVSRYALGIFISEKFKSFFPWGTLSINILACFILGVVTAWIAAKGDNSSLRMLIGVGFCGGFSTFSTFTAETMNMLSRGQTASALLYIAGSVSLCMMAFAAATLVK
jgi:CrcB protein